MTRIAPQWYSKIREKFGWSRWKKLSSDRRDFLARLHEAWLEHHAKATAEKVGEITDSDVEAVENEVGMGAPAWDCISPKEIVAAARKPVEEELAKLREENARIESDNHRLRLGDMSAFDYERLVEWIKDPNRIDPTFAFTAGSLRTAAKAVVDSGVLSQLAELKTKVAQLRAANNHIHQELAARPER